MGTLTRLATVCLAALFCAPAALATWSIVIVDSRTGEVALGCATCVAGIDLKPITGVVRVGIGGGATQAAAPPGDYRRVLFSELKKGTPPELIIELMNDLGSGDANRQFGIADHERRAATYSGSGTAAWSGGRAGRIGSISYSIQGNIMVGEPVIAMAEFGVLTTDGDLADKLMAGMEAARVAGGDKRCTSYGKSSHTAYMVVARMGDIDAPCHTGDDCANGTYFLDFDVANTKATDPDPVITLGQLFQAWRASWVGRPDHVKSAVSIQSVLTPADRQTTAHMVIALADWQGKLIGHGGASVIVTHDPASANSSLIGNVQDRGDGSYAVALTPSDIVGEDIFQVIVDDGVSPVRLYPNPSYTVGRALRLRTDVTKVSASQPHAVGLLLRASVPFVGRHYLVLLSASGTEPGFDVGRAHVPLNLDAVLEGSYLLRNTSVLPGSEGTLDQDARAEARFVPRPGDLDLLVGATLSFAYLTREPDDFASEVVQVQVVP